MNKEISDVAMQSVESSNIVAVGYVAEEEVIVVKFKGGATYAYDDCSQQLFDQLLNAPSAGKFVHANLKGKSTERVRG